MEISLRCKHSRVGLTPVEIYSCVKSWKKDPDSLDLQTDTLRKAVRGIWFLRPFYLFISFIYLFLSALGLCCVGLSLAAVNEDDSLVVAQGLLIAVVASHRDGGFSLPSTGSRHAGSSSCLQSECRDSSPNNQTHTHTHTMKFYL